MTHLVEDITIKITLNHCTSIEPSTVLGGKRDLRKDAAEMLTGELPRWLRERIFIDRIEWDGIEIVYENTGLQEVPELGGGDN